uniref:palindromic element RPE1 domain-containing protein n=1 Tax=Candidatus Rickettsia kedanie TaxID=3115352 RepID=UPI00399D07E1
MEPLRKRGFREEFEGYTEVLATATYSSVGEDASLGSTYKLPLEVEFPKRSIEYNSTSLTINIANLINFKNL